MGITSLAMPMEFYLKRQAEIKDVPTVVTFPFIAGASPGQIQRGMVVQAVTPLLTINQELPQKLQMRRMDGIGFWLEDIIKVQILKTETSKVSRIQIGNNQYLQLTIMNIGIIMYMVQQMEE